MSAPTARMTIPRLELRAALLAAKLLRSTAEELSIPVDRCHAWCDSQVVLHWIRSHEPTNHALIDNYVAQIQEILSPGIWRYVPTQSNPADIATRGADMSDLRSRSMWWEGPDWLAAPPDMWPSDKRTPSESPSFTCCASVTSTNSKPNMLKMFSSLRLLRSLAYLRRIVRSRLSLEPILPLRSPLTAAEIEHSFLACVRLSQEINFKEELRRLHRKEPLPKDNPMSALYAFVHTDGTIRVGGRLQHSALFFDEQHPPIISGSCPLAQLVISWAHHRALHGGYRLTFSYATRCAWIIGGPRKIKSWLRQCVVCARLQARAASQLMAPLPPSRVTPSRAFCSTGIDYAGPFQILSARSRGVRTSKGYVAVFVCMATKGLHLELVGDLSTASFRGALDRFIGRRGMPKELWSDNATCFRRADADMREALRNAEIDWDLVAGSLAEDGISWKFIPPGAPLFGGLWEAAVKSVKKHLRRVIGPRHLIYEEFTTALCGIEMVLNSRPLVALSGGPDDLRVLTPGHLITGTALNSIIDPGPMPSLEDLDKLSHWDLVRGIRAQFWFQWSREYLNTLQQRLKWKLPRRNFVIGDIVVIIDSTLIRPDGRWPLGRIIDVHPGTDGLVRAATIKTAAGEYVRPIAKLALLPVDTTPSNDSRNRPSTAGGTTLSIQDRGGRVVESGAVLGGSAAV